MPTPKKTIPAKKRIPAKAKIEPVAAEEKDTKLEPMLELKEPVTGPRRIDADNDDFELPADFMPAEEDGGSSADGTAVRRPDRYFEAVGRRKSAVARVR